MKLNLVRVDPDHRLMNRIAHQDADAFRELITKHLNAGTRIAERMLGNRQDAEDVMQELCMKVWKEAARWQPKAKFSTWFFRVLINACIDYKRRQRTPTTIDMDTLCDESPAIDEVLINGQKRERIIEALQLLSDRQRAAMVLTYYEDMSNQQSADLLEIELGAFHQLLFRAKQNIKKRLLDDSKET